MTASFYQDLADKTRIWGKELGFQQVGIADTDLGEHEARLRDWLAAQRHGEMAYMALHGRKRSRPAELVPGTLRVITVRLNYLPKGSDAERVLASDQSGYVSRYALGRDYHKVLRSRLVKLWRRIDGYLEDSGKGGHSGRVFTDSAPVLEKALAEKSGLGWIGKNTLLLNREAGSWFFLGEIFTDVPLTPDDARPANHCGSCTACIDVCPTNAIVAPYQLDARKCISYLTIEHRGSIPVEYRSAMGNRIFGCDDCQLVCPWNKYARHTGEPDFAPRHRLDHRELLDLFAWSESEFLERTEGSAIRRAGYNGWLRNVAVALGNGPATREAIEALEKRKQDAPEMLAEHIAWAITQLQALQDSLKK
jgi:epoxyqueuosine reductase